MSSFPETYNAGAELWGGCRGCTPLPPPPPPPDDLRFSNTTSILPKKKTVWFIGVEVEQETRAPPPTWILQVPSLGLSSIFNFS